MKNNPFVDTLEQMSKLVTDSGLKEEAQSSVSALVQSTLHKMDMVNRDEYDAQTAVLQRTRQRVEELEQQLQQLAEEIEQLK